MSTLRRIGLLLVVLLAVGISGCGRQNDGKVKLVVWGPQPLDRMEGWKAAVKEFERRHPNIDVKMLSMGAGGMNPQKLMTAIVGKVPPDVIYQDRFTVGDWAARDTFMSLDRYIERDRKQPDGIKPEEYYKAAWNEAVYKGKVYAIPSDVDDRAMFYNKKLFREAGLDPNKPPQTWDELLEVTKKLTIYRNNRFERIGFIPNFGNSWFYLYSWQNGGEFMSPDGRTCTLNNPQSVQALDWLVKFYDQFKGVDQLNAFQAGFQGNEMDPFLIGRVAMRIDCGAYIWYIARYAPDMDFGVAPPPVPKDRLLGKGRFAGQPKFITWSGGFSWAVPVGVQHPNESWEFIKWMESEQGLRTIHSAQRDYNRAQSRPYVPFMSGNSRITEKMFAEFGVKNPRFTDGKRVFLKMLPDSRYRPVTFVGQRLWDEHARAFDLAIHHKLTSQQALDEGNKVVQKELDKVYDRSSFALLDWKYPIGILGLLFLGFVAFVVKKARDYGPLGALAKGEAAAGYIFASPWILGFLVFTIGPIIASVVFSFCDYDVLHAARWVGMKNYHDLLTEDWYYMGKSLYNAGFLAVIGIPINMAISLGIAMLLNTKVKGMTWYRTTYYLPSIVPMVANALLWIWLLNPDCGLINAAWRTTITQWFHLPAPPWLAEEHWAKPALIFMGTWGAGGGMILWLAGLQGVPQHLYEAADIDGAGWWCRFRNVTLPMLTPYLFFNLIMGTIGVLGAFEAQYIMTAGGPVDSTLVPVLYLFNNAFAYFKMGYASAIAWVLFAIVLILTLIQLKLAPRWVYYENDQRR